MGSKRIKWLDFAKGVAILVVVMCHAGFQSGANSPLFQIFENFLLIFAMPLFFAISGFLYKPSDNLRKFKILLYKKSASFIFPYLLFTIITLLLGMVSNRNILSNFYRIYAMPVEYLWFLYSLFIIFLIFGVMSLFHFKWYLQLSISVVLMISQIYLPWQYIKGDINPLSGIGSYMICFYIGHLMKRFHIVKKLRSSNSLFIVLSIVWIILIGIEFWITGVSYNTDLFNYPDIITKLLSIPVLFALFSKISKHKWHKWFFRYFDKYGRYTLIIYLVHLPLIFVAGKLFTKYLIINNHKLLFMAYVVVGWFGSILIYYVARKLKWIGYVFYPRRYLDNTELNPSDNTDKLIRQINREEFIDNIKYEYKVSLKKGKFIIIFSLFVFLILPFLLRFLCSKTYVNYWGNYYSNVITVLGVFITLHYDNKHNKESRIHNAYSKYDKYMDDVNKRYKHIRSLIFRISFIFRQDPIHGYTLFVYKSKKLGDLADSIDKFNKDILVLKDILEIDLHNRYLIFFRYNMRCDRFLFATKELLNVQNQPRISKSSLIILGHKLSFRIRPYSRSIKHLVRILYRERRVLLDKLRYYDK